MNKFHETHMKNYGKMFGLILVIFSLSASQVSAEGSWWQKGLDLIKSIDEGTPSKDTGSNSPSIGEMGKAFKEALQIGAENVVNKLGSVDGFNADAAIHIPLPEELNRVKKMLSSVGMSGMVDDLELKLNRAAEAATPKARKLFMDSIREMTFEDIKGIYEGPEDSATKYFQKKMTPALSTEMQPIVEGSLSQVGAIKAYDNVIGKYQNMPFVPDIKADLTAHVIQKGMDGIFYYLAKEEAAIRKDPVKQTTDLLKKVFGAE